MIKSTTSLYGLIGFPVKHSFSPLMHNYFFKKNNIDAIYLCFEILPQNLRYIRKSILSLGIKGLNVTIPYKEKITKYLDFLDKQAEIIGAVNTVKKEKNRLLGFNTDGLGFIRSLKEKAKFNPKDKKVVILGSGGAGRSLSCSLAEENISFLGLFDIKKERAKKVYLRLKRFYKNLELKVYRNKEEIDLKDIDLVINATGLGMKKNDPLVIEACKLHKNLFVYDLIYNPQKPIFLREAEKKGCKIMNGLWMLIYQGLASHQIWFNRRFERGEEILFRGLKEAI